MTTTPTLTESIFFSEEHPLSPLLRANGFVESSALDSLVFSLQNEREPDIYESGTWYWVVIRDQRQVFKDSLRIEKCRPYRWVGDIGDGPQLAYGWVDAAGNITSNAFASVMPLDDYQVIFFKPD